jgi:hypothetical protein
MTDVPPPTDKKVKMTRQEIGSTTCCEYSNYVHKGADRQMIGCR